VGAEVFRGAAGNRPLNIGARAGIMEETRRANAQKSKKKEKHRGSARRGTRNAGRQGKGEAPRRSYDRGGARRRLKEAPEAARVDRRGETEGSIRSRRVKRLGNGEVVPDTPGN